MIIDEFRVQFDQIFQNLKKELSGVRTNRPSAALVEDLKVDYYNQNLPLKAVASVSILPPRGIQIQAWDKEAVPAIVKAIETSALNLTANQDDNVIRINLPELSSERREELVRYVKKMAEEKRIQLRHLRDEANKKIQKAFDDSEINEDQKFKMKEDIQKEIDKTNAAMEDVLSFKIKEIQS